MIVTYLQHNPVVGMISAFLGYIIASLTSLLTDEATLKIIGTVSLYVGCTVGILTLIIKAVEFVRLFRKK
jgi:hypothetical protein